MPLRGQAPRGGRQEMEKRRCDGSFRTAQTALVWEGTRTYEEKKAALIRRRETDDALAYQR